jgi:hypothetical protein
MGFASEAAHPHGQFLRINTVDTYRLITIHVYADFGYPTEMRAFIYYMPNNETATDHREATHNMISDFNRYLKSLKSHLIGGN